MEKPLIGLKRNTIDKYYTKKNIVEECISLIKDNIDISNKDLIIEPSAGNGSFIDFIMSLSKNYLFYDIEPDNSKIIKQDFLLLDTKNFQQKKIHIIGNPPFGRQSSQARKFIKKSCKFCDTLSFILPKSFKKESLKKTFPLNFHLKYQWDLPKNSFLVDNIEHDVPCVFQIWTKEEFERKTKPSLKPINFKFVNKSENPEISFRRVGVNAGKISEDINNKSEQSHYFIKFTNNIRYNVHNMRISFNFKPFSNFN